MRASLRWIVHVVVVSGAATPAQTIRDERKQHLPDIAFDRLMLLDVDRDGDLDAVVGGSPIRLLLNLGRLRFADVSTQALPPLIGWPLGAADLDADGDVDLFTSGPQLLLNDRGTFTLATVGRVPALSNVTAGFALGDLDSDRDIDAFVAAQPQPWLLRNDGLATFTAVPLHADAASAATARLGDIDNDRDLDLVVTGNDRTAVLTNDGSGQFTPIASALPALSTANIVLADFDRDGDADLASGHYWFVPRQLFLSDGQGRFVDATATHLPPTAPGSNRGMYAQDIDGDGDVDLIVALEHNSELLRNDGTGRFAVGDAGDLRTLYSPQLAAGDLDGNGTIDLLTHPVHVLIGRQQGAFVTIDGDAFAADAMGVIAIADFTGDGDDDVLQFWSGSSYVVKRNDGTGSFPASHYAFLPPFPPSVGAAAAAGDVDGDGDRDVVRLSYNLFPAARELSVARNDGAGAFAPPTSTPRVMSPSTAWLHLDDVDSDGDLDALDIDDWEVSLFANDGRGNFSFRGRLAFARATSSELFDYDGDGDRDLFLGGSAVVVLENRRGTYVDVAAQRFAGTPPGGMARLGRVNGRTWLFVFASSLLVYEVGANSFTPRPDLTDAGSARHMRVAPSGDGLDTLDLVVGYGASMRVLRFNGFSRPTEVTGMLLGNAQYDDLQAAGDLDGDGDSDWLGTRGQQDHRVLRGARRSFTTPYAPFLGQDFEYRIFDVMSGSPTVVSLLLGTRAIRFPVPGIGVLRVDPQSLFVLPPIVLPGPPTSITLRVPANAALRDVALVAQPWSVYPARGIMLLGAASHDVIR